MSHLSRARGIYGVEMNVDHRSHSCGKAACSERGVKRKKILKFSGYGHLVLQSSEARCQRTNEVRVESVVIEIIDKKTPSREVDGADTG